LGSEIRGYNQAAAAADRQAVAAARRRVAKSARDAMRHGAEPLLQLRAFQMLRFIDEVRRWQRGGEASRELVELGGDFIATVEQNRWCRGGPRQLLLDDDVLRVLFKKRWNDLTGLGQGPFEASVDEERVRFGFLIEHPFTTRTDALQTAKDDRVATVRRQQERLEMIERLAERDAAYPADLARGIVYFQLGRWGHAVDHLRRHVDAHPDGPQSLRARNYLKAALDQARTVGL
jgi:hypothetical protein